MDDGAQCKIAGAADQKGWWKSLHDRGRAYRKSQRVVRGRPLEVRIPVGAVENEIVTVDRSTEVSGIAVRPVARCSREHRDCPWERKPLFVEPDNHFCGQ